MIGITCGFHNVNVFVRYNYTEKFTNFIIQNQNSEMDFKLEVCVDSVESAMNAQEAGADRVELCSALPEGGITPGAGTISSVRASLSIGLHIIIRPRAGDFLYNDIEYDIMRREIDICGESGADGIVLGILHTDGRIDIERTAKLIEYGRPMTATFHRAFDMGHDPVRGLHDVIQTGAERLLTSGQRNKAEEGAELIAQLIRLSQDKLIIMPGSGLNRDNIVRIARLTHAKEFHLTGRKTVNSDMVFQRQIISMGSSDLPEFSRKVADTRMIKDIVERLKES